MWDYYQILLLNHLWNSIFLKCVLCFHQLYDTECPAVHVLNNKAAVAAYSLKSTKILYGLRIRVDVSVAHWLRIRVDNLYLFNDLSARIVRTSVCHRRSCCTSTHVWGMTNYHIGLRGTTSKHIGQYRTTWDRFGPLRTTWITWDYHTRLSEIIRPNLFRHNLIVTNSNNKWHVGSTTSALRGDFVITEIRTAACVLQA